MKKLIILLSVLTFDVNAAFNKFEEETEKEQLAHNRGLNIGAFRAISQLFETIILKQKSEDLSEKYRKCMAEISDKQINRMQNKTIHFFINQENLKCRKKIGL
jgi:hypothetical protein